MRQRMRCQIQCAMETAAVVPHVGEGFGMPRRRRAQSLQRIGAPAKLLQNGIVWDRPQFARVADARGARDTVRLSRRGPRTGSVKQRWAERTEYRAVAGVLDERFHAGANG